MFKKMGVLFLRYYLRTISLGSHRYRMANTNFRTVLMAFLILSFYCSSSNASSIRIWPLEQQVDVYPHRPLLGDPIYIRICVTNSCSIAAMSDDEYTEYWHQYAKLESIQCDFEKSVKAPEDLVFQKFPTAPGVISIPESPETEKAMFLQDIMLFQDMPKTVRQLEKIIHGKGKPASTNIQIISSQLVGDKTKRAILNSGTTVYSVLSPDTRIFNPGETFVFAECTTEIRVDLENHFDCSGSGFFRQEKNNDYDFTLKVDSWFTKNDAFQVTGYTQESVT